MSVSSRNSTTVWPIITKFFVHVACAHDLVHCWRHCDMLSSSSFADNVMFSFHTIGPVLSTPLMASVCSLCVTNHSCHAGCSFSIPQVAPHNPALAVQSIMHATLAAAYRALIKMSWAGTHMTQVCASMSTRTTTTTGDREWNGPNYIYKGIPINSAVFPLFMLVANGQITDRQNGRYIWYSDAA